MEYQKWFDHLRRIGMKKGNKKMAKFIRVVELRDGNRYSSNMHQEDAEKFMQDLGRDAHKVLRSNENQNIHHCIYAIKLYDEEWNVVEYRLYFNKLMTEEAFGEIADMKDYLGFKNFIIKAHHK